MQHDLEYWKVLELNTRRGMSEALHPDRCPKLHLHGVEWAIPPLLANATLEVDFSDGEPAATLREPDGESWPEATELIQLADLQEGDPCPECGRPRRAELAAEVGGKFLKTAMRLAGRLLDKQYRLTAEQKGDLLSAGLDGDALPDWVVDLVVWTTSGTLGAAVNTVSAAAEGGVPEAWAEVAAQQEDAPNA